MIRDFWCENTERIFNGEVSRRFPTDIQSVARRKLRQLDAATGLNDLRSPPGNRLEKLEHNREGQYSIRINDQWRLCFIWDNGARRVEICDYH